MNLWPPLSLEDFILYVSNPRPLNDYKAVGEGLPRPFEPFGLKVTGEWTHSLSQLNCSLVDLPALVRSLNPERRPPPTQPRVMHPAALLRHPVGILRHQVTEFGVLWFRWEIGWSTRASPTRAIVVSKERTALLSQALFRAHFSARNLLALLLASSISALSLSPGHKDVVQDARVSGQGLRYVLREDV
jgi:hypothetical protein